MLAAAGVASFAMVLSACGNNGPSTGSSSGGTGANTSTSIGSINNGSGTTGVIPEKGGTLNVLELAGATGTLDPAESYAGTSTNLSPLFIATLTEYVPDATPPRLIGELATNTGDPSDGYRDWTFHLKPDIKYSNGETITSQDIKYDVERSFASDLAGGPPYISEWLKGAKGYKGPYVDKKGLSSIVTPNSKTIEFELNQPVGDFNNLTVFPEFSGVPQALDTGVKYQYNPLSSGPYMIKHYVDNENLTLVRNPHWNTATDPYDKAYPNEINVSLGLSAPVIDQELIADNGTNKDAVGFEPVQASDVGQVLSTPSVKSRAMIASSGQGFTYLADDIQKKPLNNLKVREAIEYAVNKSTVQTAFGGPVAGGPVDNQILGPGVPGYKPFNLYAASPAGDPAKAKALLAAAGYPHGFSTVLSVQSTPSWVSAAEAIQSSLKAVGIKASIETYNPEQYINGFIGEPAKETGLQLTQWGSDWDNASTILPDLFNGSTLTAAGPNNNVTNFNSPSLDKIMTKASSFPDSPSASALWAEADKDVMAQAIVTPLVYRGVVFLHGSSVVGAQFDEEFGAPNIQVMAVNSKKA
jgi:peptide/nickel transport system substrate-binding protein